MAYGVSARIVRSAVSKAREQGIKAGWIRPITLWPFPAEQTRKVADESQSSSLQFLVVEMSYGQMVEDVKLALAGKCEISFYGRAGGGIPTVDKVFEKIKQLMEC